MNKKVIWGIGLGCGIPILLAFLLFITVFVFLFTGPEGGVRAANNMEQYAVDYINNNNIIADNENIKIYYDVTMSLDSSECAILTDKRLIYYKNGNNTEISVDKISRVASQDLGIVGDGITVFDEDDNMIYIEIAALNNSEIFFNALQRQVEKNKEQKK